MAARWKITSGRSWIRVLATPFSEKSAVIGLVFFGAPEGIGESSTSTKVRRSIVLPASVLSWTRRSTSFLPIMPPDPVTRIFIVFPVLQGRTIAYAGRAASDAAPQRKCQLIDLWARPAVLCCASGLGLVSLCLGCFLV